MNIGGWVGQSVIKDMMKTVTKLIAGILTQFSLFTSSYKIKYLSIQLGNG